VGNLTYLLILCAALVGAGWLEVVFRTRVLRRWQRLILTVVPVIVVFGLWDVYAIIAGHWWFDAGSVTGVSIGRLPLDELLFFVVIPYCAILTLEAVRVARGWTVGDER
jgi:lycopene cyclase domain-containing protein